MSDDRRDEDGPRRSMSGTMVGLGPLAQPVIELQQKLTLAVAATLVTHAGQDPALVAAEAARLAYRPLAQVYFEVRQASLREGFERGCASRETLDLLAAKLGAAFESLGRLEPSAAARDAEAHLTRVAEALDLVRRASDSAVPCPPTTKDSR